MSRTKRPRGPEPGAQPISAAVPFSLPRSDPAACSPVSQPLVGPTMDRWADGSLFCTEMAGSGCWCGMLSEGPRVPASASGIGVCEASRLVLWHLFWPLDRGQ